MGFNLQAWKDKISGRLWNRRSRMPEAPVEEGAPKASGTAVQMGSGAIAQGAGAVAAGEGGVAIGRDHYGDVHIGTPPVLGSPKDLREAYLAWLMEGVRAVPLTGVDPKSIREETRRDLDLAAVYTALMVTEV